MTNRKTILGRQKTEKKRKNREGVTGSKCQSINKWWKLVRKKKKQLKENKMEDHTLSTIRQTKKKKENVGKNGIICRKYKIKSKFRMWIRMRRQKQRSFRFSVPNDSGVCNERHCFEWPWWLQRRSQNKRRRGGPLMIKTTGHTDESECALEAEVGSHTYD